MQKQTTMRTLLLIFFIIAAAHVSADDKFTVAKKDSETGLWGYVNKEESGRTLWFQRAKRVSFGTLGIGGGSKNELLTHGYEDEWVISPQYENVAKEFSEGLAAVQLHGKVGYIDTLNRFVIEPKFESMKNLDGFSLCFLLRGMGRVAFLPQEFSRTQEEAGTHFPAEHVGPLVDQDGQVAIGVDPVLVRIPDDGFRSGADDQFLLQFGLGVYHYASAVGVILQAIVGDDGTFLGKSFHMFCLAAEEGFRDEQGEIGIDMARFLEHVIQLALHFLPDGISVGPGRISPPVRCTIASSSRYAW